MTGAAHSLISELATIPGTSRNRLGRSLCAVFHYRVFYFITSADLGARGILSGKHVKKELMQLLAQPQLMMIALDQKDVVYTPEWAARDMVEFFRPEGRILEPCKGGGVFLDFLPSHTEWCEIQEGKDFFAWSSPVDWCFGNPPYRMFGKWMYHSMAIASDICYLLPCDKPFISWKMLKTMRTWGRVKHMRVYGTGSSLNFPMGFAVGALHFQKGYHGPMETSYYPEPTQASF